MILLVLLGVLLACWGGLLAWYRRPLLALWQEPVLRRPVLILESDDWGAGPQAQADALDALNDLLLRYRDETGRPAVMTLGVVLAAAERLDDAQGELHLSTLGEPEQNGVMAALRRGQACGTLIPQLHGLAHFAPEVLAAAARRDSAVAAWCHAGPAGWTEDLPASLQSTLIDGVQIPSRELPASAIATSIEQQGQLWRALFGQAPEVAVPTTFIWNDAAESAWAAIGVRWLVTPGHRATTRDANGQPSGVDRSCLTGQRTPAGLGYLVRDVYFEPVLGHAPARVLDALALKVAQGRACLVETHRFNYAGPRATRDSLAPLAELLEAVLQHHPGVRFMATAELGTLIARRDPAHVMQSPKARMRAWLARIRGLPRFGTIAARCGLITALQGIARVMP